MILAINGPPGSGKSTIAQLLADKLGFKRYYMGGLQREMARKRGITIDEHNALCKIDPKADKEVDTYQKELGEKEDNFVIEGRTSFHFIPHAIKIYVTVDIEEGARRILADNKQKERNEDSATSLKEKVKKIKERLENESKRYKAFYNFDCHDPTKADIIIDTTNISAEEASKNILEIIQEEYR